MNLVGYTDRLSAGPGDVIEFMVSSRHARYQVELVQLIHGDESPRGPGYREREVSSSIAGHYPGRMQQIYSGSCVRVPGHEAVEAMRSFTVTAWVFPTAPAGRLQGLISQWPESSDVPGFALVIGDDGVLRFWLRGQHGGLTEVSSGVPLLAASWSLVGASYDGDTGRVVVWQLPKVPSSDGRGQAIAEDVVDRPVHVTTGRPLVIGALSTDGPEVAAPIRGAYNGKVDSPRIYSCAVVGCPATGQIDWPGFDDLADSLVAAWRFDVDLDQHRVIDHGPHAMHGDTVNMPTRGVTGFNWTGDETSFRLAPDEYGAIHFHDDDLEDARWVPDFRLTIPDDLSSGVYAARLRAGEDEEYLPFFVRPPRGTARARVAVLMPTLTYVVYANFRDIDGGFWDPERLPNVDPDLHQAEFAYIRENGLPGLYERHSDGSGTTYVSHRRPILNMRPKFRYRVWGTPARFPADLYLIDWLDALGFEVDVLTDHDLHAEGEDLLAPYRVVLTGAHPEYWTASMRAGLETYLGDGGRLMYLGGNGFFGVTSIDEDRPHIVEVRRWGTSWPFEMPPGERVHSTTGEPGGTWRNRGQTPQALVGVGSCSAGFDRGSPYLRQAESFDPAAAFIFEGVDDTELIGDFPSLMVQHGAAGYEMDRADDELGTPPHTLLLASSINHSSKYVTFMDEILQFTQGKDGVLPGEPPVTGVPHPFVRADMTYLQLPGGGAVFSVGSIAWRGSLSYNQYENNVSRITANVLRRFMTDVPAS